MMAPLLRRKKVDEDLDDLIVQGYLILDELSQANERWRKGHEALKETIDKIADVVKERGDEQQGDK